MRRLFTISVLGTAALLLPLSLLAQRGMSGRGGGGFSGHGGGGFRSAGPSGFRSAGPSGFRSAGPSGFRSSGPSGFRTFTPAQRNGFSTFGPGSRTFVSRPFVSRPFVSRPFPSSRVFVSRPFVNRPFGFHRFNRPFFFNTCFGFPCRSPFFFGGSFFTGGLFFGSPFYPFYPSDYYYPYGPYGYPYASPAPVVYGNSDNGSTAQLTTEVQRLSDEVADLRYESRARNDNSDQPPADSDASNSAGQPAMATLFVFRDGRRISAQNYAIAGQTLWLFNEHTARKYALSDLDTQATEKANAPYGIELHFPEAPK